MSYIPPAFIPLRKPVRPHMPSRSLTNVLLGIKFVILSGTVFMCALIPTFCPQRPVWVYYYTVYVFKFFALLPWRWFDSLGTRRCLVP